MYKVGFKYGDTLYIHTQIISFAEVNARSSNKATSSEEAIPQNVEHK